MNKISNQNLFCFHKNNLKKRRITQIYRHFIFVLIYIFFILLKETYEQSEIYLIVNRIGLSIVGNEFYKKSFYLRYNDTVQSNLYNMTLIFDSFIVSCENMFNGVTKIVEIDLSNFDNSKVTNIVSMF